MYQAAPIISLSGYRALRALARGGTGVSQEADSVRKAANSVAESTERSMALFGRKATALSQLATMATEHAHDNWDGAGAIGVDPIAVHLAEQFVRSLPEDVPLPEFAPEPDGSVSLDWIQSRNRLLSLSIGSGDRLAFAWLDGTDKGHAVARFDGQSVPERLLTEIDSIVGRDASLWAA